MKLIVLYCFSSSSSDFAPALSWTEPVRSLCALLDLAYANAPPPRATTATPAATQATVRFAPPAEAAGEGRGASATAIASSGAFRGSGADPGLATAGLAPAAGGTAATGCAGSARAGCPARGVCFFPGSAVHDRQT